eukprot:365020-Chlamydomonas_euryale.AAC.2
MLALKKLNLIKECDPPFSGAEQRFEQRFGRFSALVQVPEAYSYADFAASTDVTDFTAQALLGLAVEAFEMVGVDGIDAQREKVLRVLPCPKPATWLATSGSARTIRQSPSVKCSHPFGQPPVP